MNFFLENSFIFAKLYRMKSIQKRKGAPMNRRDVLKSAGCLVMLPALESFGQEAKGDDDVKANR